MKKTLVVYSFALLCSPEFSAQDAAEFNSNQNLINLNPSFAGSNGLLRNQFSFQNRWPNLSSTTLFYRNTTDAYIAPLKAGLAISAAGSDEFGGYLKTQAIALSYAQYFSLSDDRLKVIPSVQLSYNQIALDINSFTGGFVWNSPYPQPPSRVNYFDVSTGVLVAYLDRLYVGGTVFHINNPQIGHFNREKLPARYNLHASYSFLLSDHNLLQIFSQYLQQQDHRFIEIAANVVLADHLMAGAGFRSGDVAHVNGGYRWNKFSLLLGYNLTYSRLAENVAGSWSIHASFNLRKGELRNRLTNFERM